MEYQLPKGLMDVLHSRHIPHDTISYLQQEKIDCQVINAMKDEDLNKIFPLYGDRVAIVEFCKKDVRSSHRKESLFERLKSRFTSKRKKKSVISSSEDEEAEDEILKKQKCGKHKGKPTRYVEIGWLHHDGVAYKQVRTVNGGGTRKIQMSKFARKIDLVTAGKEIFFPGGKSAKGLELEKFSTNLLDFSSQSLADDMTVEQMFNVAKLSKLRVYFATKEAKCETVTSGAYEDLANCSQETSVYDQDVYTLEYDMDDLITLSYREESVRSSTDQELPNVSTSQGEEGANSSVPFTSENELIHSNQPGSLHDSIHEINSLSNEKFILHRGQIFEELIGIFSINAFEMSNIHVSIMQPNGEMEAAEDLGGVWRDTLSEFWRTMFDKCTIGIQVRVPQLRHDFNATKWTAIAKILKKGWESERYFPISLSKAFMEMCIFKNCQCDLIQEFLNFANNDERLIFEVALQKFENVDQDELIEILSRYECKVLPTNDNFKPLLYELAEQEIIQKTAFISDSFHEVLGNLLPREMLYKIYEDCKPTSRNILKILSFDNILSQERDKAAPFLKRFIRDSSEEIRMAFLRFTTGSDILLGGVIKVVFSRFEREFQRRPIAHTCTNTLELPENYENYLDFRLEFTSILQSNIWIMEIV